MAVMNRVAKNNFKSQKPYEGDIVMQLSSSRPSLGRRIARPTCSRCKTIMYPGPENSGYNHRRGFCTGGAKQVSQTESPPPWAQPPGIFSDGKRFHLRAFFKTVKQIYEQVFKSGTVLFELYEELKVDATTPDALLTMHNSVKHLHIEYLQEHWA